MIDQKKTIMFFMTLGSLAGGYMPSLLGADMFSMSSILLSAVGGFLGIWVGYKIYTMYF